MRAKSLRLACIFAGASCILPALALRAQQLRPLATQRVPLRPDSSSTDESAQPVSLTLQDALARARKNSVVFQAAVMDAALAHEDKTQARDALLPSVAYNNGFLYTQGNEIGAVRYIANNAIHEYISQGNVHEAIDAAGVAEFRRASSSAAVARARAEVASRGLVVTVVQSYYAVLSAKSRFDLAQRTSTEGEQFLKLTQDLESGGEVAHSDVIKAELQMRDRRRQLREAQLALLNARLDFAVLIFPDFNDNFVLTDDLHADVPLPEFPEVEQQAARDNPDVRAALEGVREAGHEVSVQRAGYLPALTVDYFYGIDSAQFSVNSVVDGTKFSNLGSSAAATLNIPVWNWGATQSRVKQAELKRVQAQRELSLAQRKLLAEIRSLYGEADAARNELSDLSRSAELSSESLKLTTLRYKGGEATVLEVVDAQNSFATANAAYHDGAVRYRVALANLQTLTGVLSAP